MWAETIVRWLVCLQLGSNTHPWKLDDIPYFPFLEDWWLPSALSTNLLIYLISYAYTSSNWLHVVHRVLSDRSGLKYSDKERFVTITYLEGCSKSYQCQPISCHIPLPFWCVRRGAYMQSLSPKCLGNLHFPVTFPLNGILRFPFMSPQFLILKSG